jgi:hypothetical protein
MLVLMRIVPLGPLHHLEKSVVSCTMTIHRLRIHICSLKTIYVDKRRRVQYERRQSGLF